MVNFIKEVMEIVKHDSNKGMPRCNVLKEHGSKSLYPRPSVLP